MNISEMAKHAVGAHPEVELRLMAGAAGHIIISMIRTAPESRGRGHAEQVMRKLCELADAHGITLALTLGSPETEKRVSKIRLIQWYNSHGFVANKGRRRNFEIFESMVRYPHSS